MCGGGGGVCVCGGGGGGDGGYSFFKMKDNFLILLVNVIPSLQLMKRPCGSRKTSPRTSLLCSLYVLVLCDH